jgi:hypothetical protein
MNVNVEQRRPIRFSLRALMVFVVLCCFASFLLRAFTVTVSAESVGASRANRLLWDVGSPLQVPVTATNVTLWAWFRQAQASFEIDEKDLLDWTGKQNWKVEPITGGHCKAMQILSQCFEPNFPESIANGYSFSNSSHRGGWDVVYDRLERRAWVHYSHN